MPSMPALNATVAGLAFACVVASAQAARGPDFNGDGYTDFATTLHGDINGIFLAGQVHVMYGSVTGLSGAGDRVFHQNKPDMPDAVAELDHFGDSLGWGDFNHDGFDDLAIGVLREDNTAENLPAPGAVHVLYGSESGLVAAGSAFWKPQDFLPSTFNETHLMSVAAAGDFNGDAIDDLVLRVENTSDEALRIVFGQPGGLDPHDSQLLMTDGSWSHASADFNGDGIDDLAIGGDESATVVHGSLNGLTLNDLQVWSQDSPGIQSPDEPLDSFGHTLASGDFNGDGFDDLAASGGSAWVNGKKHAGAVRILYGSSDGLTAIGTQRWHQGSPGIKGPLHSGDYFGSGLAVGDFDDDGFDDLAVGAPTKNVNVKDSGSVNVLYGSSAGLTSSGDQYWHQDSSGLNGKAEKYDRFGARLTTGDFNGDGVQDLLVGVLGQKVSGVYAAGAVHIIFGTSAAGLTAVGNQIMTKSSPGISQNPAHEDRLGQTMTQSR